MKFKSMINKIKKKGRRSKKELIAPE